MTSEALASKPKQDVNSLARRMAIALIAGLGIGALLLFLRENLITNGHQETWNIINNLFFQDILSTINNRSNDFFINSTCYV